MRHKTSVKPGTLVRLSRDLQDNDMFGSKIWAVEVNFLKSPHDKTLLKNVSICPDDLCIVIKADRYDLLIITPKGEKGWIKKTKMEVVK